VTATLVSAIMPVYNGEEFLEASLTSLHEQDYPALEIVVCNDGSTDRSDEILGTFDSVRVVSQENRGVAAALNAAIEASSGEFVAACGCDDLWPPNRMTLQAAHLDQHPAVGCVLGRQVWMNPPPWLGRDPVYGELDGIPLGSAMFRRSVLTQVGGFDESFRHSEDMDLLVRLREHGTEIAILPEIIHYRRFHGGNLTANPPETSPLLRSLRSKLERERADADGA
jgi:glycosyltransferase involved in cell wall biosynthesis